MKNISTQKGRVLQYIEYKVISKNKFYISTGVSNGTLDKNSGLSGDTIEKICSAYPDINIEWLITGNGSMLKPGETVDDGSVVRKEEVKGETRPRIPMDAAAGSLSVAAAGITINDCEQIPIIRAFARYDFTIFARGDSMLPEYHSGDELACVYIKNTSFIQWGRIHVIDTAQGILVKRIFDGDDSIICKSDNPAYPEFKIHKSELYNVALVIGMLRRY